MANATSTLELNDGQAKTARTLATTLQISAGILLFAGVLRLALGVYTLLFVANVGALFIVEALPLAFLGLVLLGTARSARYMVETKYTSIHLGNLFRDLAVHFQTMFYVAGFFALVALGWLIFA